MVTEKIFKQTLCDSVFKLTLVKEAPWLTEMFCTVCNKNRTKDILP